MPITDIRSSSFCLGYKAEIIRDYFRNYNYLWNTCDVTLKLGRAPDVRFHNRHNEEDWTVSLAYAGDESGRAHRSNASSASTSFLRIPIRFAGRPAQISQAGTSSRTKERAPMMAPSPMVTPGKMTAFVPTTA